jgi:hypothetical protein
MAEANALGVKLGNATSFWQQALDAGNCFLTGKTLERRASDTHVNAELLTYLRKGFRSLDLKIDARTERFFAFLVRLSLYHSQSFTRHNIVKSFNTVMGNPADTIEERIDYILSRTPAFKGLSPTEATRVLESIDPLAAVYEENGMNLDSVINKIMGSDIKSDHDLKNDATNKLARDDKAAHLHYALIMSSPVVQRFFAERRRQRAEDAAKAKRKAAQKIAEKVERKSVEVKAKEAVQFRAEAFLQTKPLKASYKDSKGATTRMKDIDLEQEAECMNCFINYFCLLDVGVSVEQLEKEWKSCMGDCARYMCGGCVRSGAMKLHEEGCKVRKIRKAAAVDQAKKQRLK